MRYAGAALCGLLLAIVLAPSGAAGPKVTVRSGWPCDGCIVEVPGGSKPGRPTAVLVLLHGDEGAPSEIAGMIGPPALARNVIVFAPQCPAALGCRQLLGSGGYTSSWWGWLQSSQSYSDAWLGRQIALVESAYAVDGRSTYLIGWSGGADYMGWYALQHSAEFAGAAFVAGGVPYHPSCPSTRLAGYFLFGSADPRYQTGQPATISSILARCGDAVKTVVIPGADHVGTMMALSQRGYAAKILAWLLAHHPARSG